MFTDFTNAKFISSKPTYWETDKHGAIGELVNKIKNYKLIKKININLELNRWKKESMKITLHKKWSFPSRIFFFSKYDQIQMRIWSHSLKKSSVENLIFVFCKCKNKCKCLILILKGIRICLNGQFQTAFNSW